MLNSSPLKRATPESQGVSSRELLKTIKLMDESVNEVHGFMIERNGYVLAESWLAPYRADYPHTCHSLGKSYTCTAIGICATKGLLSVDDLIVDIFADEIKLWGITPDPIYRRLKLRDVMCMGDGMERMPGLGTFWLEDYLSVKLKYEPSEHFMYNTTASCVLGAVVEKVTGMSTYDFLKKELFDKIGIGDDDLVWLRFPNGICAEPGISATTEANLRLGMFYVDDGLADGSQIIDKEWIRNATSVQNRDKNGDYIANTAGYGWQLWICDKEGQFRFEGGQGQMMIADRPHNAVCAFHQAGRDPKGYAYNNVLIQELMSSFGNDTLPEDEEGYAELQSYLANRALPDMQSRPVPQNAKKWEGIYGLKDGHPYFWLEVCPGPEFDFYHNFYDVSVKRETEIISFKFDGDDLLLTVNNASVFRLSLKGKLEAGDTRGVIPQLTKTCGTAYFENENELVTYIRYLNGWQTNVTHFRLDGADLTIDIEKDMLHEGREPIRQHGTARKIR